MALKVHFVREQVTQFGDTFQVHVPWFTLEDTATGQSLWSRHGNWRTDDPHKFHVSDEGWSVISFHGRDKHARLVVLSPEGQIVLTVGITCFATDVIDQTSVPEGRWFLWRDGHVEGSTVGILWDFRSRSRFFRRREHLYFVCRMEWGRYLVIDVKGAGVVEESELSIKDLLIELRYSDEEWALSILQKTSEQREELESLLSEKRLNGTELPNALATLWENAFVALKIIRQERCLAAGALLKKLQSLSAPAFHGSIDIHPVKGFGCICSHPFREYVHLAMLSVGVRPNGHALQVFSNVYDYACAQDHCLVLPECVAGREDILRSLEPGIAPKDVVFRLGAPEYIRSSSPDGKALSSKDAYMECWDYDHPEEGVPVSWSLFWRRKKEPMSPEEKAKAMGDFWDWMAYKEEHPSMEDESDAELIAITRIVWDKSYSMMRDGERFVGWGEEEAGERQS